MEASLSLALKVRVGMLSDLADAARLAKAEAKASLRPQAGSARLGCRDGSWRHGTVEARRWGQRWNSRNRGSLRVLGSILRDDDSWSLRAIGTDWGRQWLVDRNIAWEIDGAIKVQRSWALLLSALERGDFTGKVLSASEFRAASDNLLARGNLKWDVENAADCAAAVVHSAF